VISSRDRIGVAVCMAIEVKTGDPRTACTTLAHVQHMRKRYHPEVSPTSVKPPP
jgi:hypothetical protein